ncbi:hypothetical protein JHN49_30605 [Streptomyces sp. MBT57]|nr:hypothetical protein [Streptomyces sp. MBT57]
MSEPMLASQSSPYPKNRVWPLSATWNGTVPAPVEWRARSFAVPVSMTLMASPRAGGA